MAYLKGALLGKALDLHTNIRLNWNGLRGTNTLAYFKQSEITTIKSFIILGPGQRGQVHVNCHHLHHRALCPARGHLPHQQGDLLIFLLPHFSTVKSNQGILKGEVSLYC